MSFPPPYLSPGSGEIADGFLTPFPIARREQNGQHSAIFSIVGPTTK
jgi:hypothetical protein